MKWTHDKWRWAIWLKPCMGIRSPAFVMYPQTIPELMMAPAGHSSQLSCTLSLLNVEGNEHIAIHINVWDVLQLLYRFYTAGKCKQQVIYVHDRKISDAVPSRCGNADDACCWTRFRSKQYNAAKCPVTLSRLPHIRRDASRNCICPLSRVLDYYSAPWNRRSGRQFRKMTCSRLLQPHGVSFQATFRCSCPAAAPAANSSGQRSVAHTKTKTIIFICLIFYYIRGCNDSDMCSKIVNKGRVCPGNEW
jgi:hypothetical protein